MRCAVILVAAGSGRRAGGEKAKQWQALAGRRVYDWSYDAFARREDIDTIIVVYNPQDPDALDLGSRAIKIDGANTRMGSVRAGLEALARHEIDRVLIHDAARACVSQEVINRVISALDNAPAAAPGRPVVDALWSTDGPLVSGLRERQGLLRAQTPQGFHYDKILAAHRGFSGEALDDVAVALSTGIAVTHVEGDENNVKITYPEDFQRAQRILRGSMDIRAGHGYDVHAFCTGDSITLCGVTLPFERSLKGHSDADVGLHALTDALYGALADGDIGQHFPPSDDQWKAADSAVFLRHAVELVHARGYKIASLDCTLICERPKIGPNASAMRARVAEIAKMEIGRVSIKATTSEKLGFTGREEGIAAMATALLVTQ